MSESRNFFLAIGLSIAVLVLWQTLIEGPRIEEERARQAALEAEQAAVDESTVGGEAGEEGNVPRADGAIPTPANRSRATPQGVLLSRDEALAQSERVVINSPGIQGSIALTGGRIDDVQLKRYRTTVDPESPIVTLLSPRGSENAYYAQFGWTAGNGSKVKVPEANTVWSAMSSDPLTPDNPVTLFWENGAGVRFMLRYEIDDNYLITVTHSVRNESGSDLVLYPYGLVSRTGQPKTEGFWILHEGFIGVFGDAMQQFGWGGLEEGPVQQQTNAGWVGMTSKYWMTALAPSKGESFTGRFSSPGTGSRQVFQADYLLEPQVVPAGATAEAGSYLFAGAKKVSIIDQYRENYGIERFDLAIDWGWFFFLTRPFFYALSFINSLVGNFGVAILVFTVLVKLVFFPLANKSYEAMTKMKKVQPDLMKLRDRFKDDKMRQQQEMMELYKREKINPLAGCLPVLIQIPVFFALYKVLFVTIEMRHAPFFGWIQDLSAPDPTSVFNLFGLIPWDPSVVPVLGPFLMLGVWPLFMGVTMWLQMQMNPKPTDEIQAKVFAYMPFIFTFLLASFSAGLVIYWAWNNLLSILQQYVIMRRMGVEPEWKNNIKLPFLNAPDSAPQATAAATLKGDAATGSDAKTVRKDDAKKDSDGDDGDETPDGKSSGN